MTYVMQMENESFLQQYNGNKHALWIYQNGLQDL